MNKKQIIFSNGDRVRLTVEETLSRFKDMIRKFAHDCNRNFYNSNSGNDFEDYYQIGCIKLTRVYDKYDPEKGLCFTTLLEFGLSNSLIDIARSLEADKRKIDKSVCGLEESIALIEGECSRGDDWTKEDEEISIQKLEQFILHNLTEQERILLCSDFKKKIYNASNGQKKNLIYLIQILQTGSLNGILTKMQLCELMQCSQPTVRARTKKALEKLKGSVEKYYAANNIDFNTLL